MSINKVLICDDSKTEIANITGIVQNEGCHVIVTHTGEEAINKAKENRPDLIFLDIVMPDMDGYATCRKLQEDDTTKNIPVVFVSSKGQKADRLWAKMQGADDLIVKPYEAAQIVEKLRAV